MIWGRREKLGVIMRHTDEGRTIDPCPLRRASDAFQPVCEVCGSLHVPGLPRLADSPLCPLFEAATDRYGSRLCQNALEEDKISKPLSRGFDEAFH